MCSSRTLRSAVLAAGFSAVALPATATPGLPAAQPHFLSDIIRLCATGKDREENPAICQVFARATLAGATGFLRPPGK